jgi:hypothetical protein
MARYHQIAPGEHITEIARRTGHRVETIWNHEENEPLRRSRRTPHVLAEGDRVFIPDPRPRSESIATGKTHVCRIAPGALMLRLRLVGMDGGPLAKELVLLDIGGTKQDLVTDATGHLEFLIPLETRTVFLTVRTLRFLLEVGQLEPASTKRGLASRLDNLGYDVGSGRDPDRLRRGIEEFQLEHGMKVDGEPSDRTLDRLELEHGC